MLKKYFLPLLLLTLIILPAVVFAQEAGLLSSVSENCRAKGNCSICEIIGTAIYIFKWVMGMLGGAVLLLFVWHGFSLIISAGEAEKVKKAREGLAHTLIGLAIVFGSWLIVNVVIVTLTDSTKTKLLTGGIGTIFDGQTAWNDYCDSSK